VLLISCIGQNEDKILASCLASLVCIQLGAGTDSECFFKALKPLLISVVQDPAASPNARGSVSLIVLA